MKRLQYLALIVLGGVSFFQAAHAYTLKSLDSPIPVISGVLLQKEDIRDGADFYATLSEPVTYRQVKLPEGTQFIGHVTGGRLSKHMHLHRGGVNIWIDQVVFPNGSRYTIYPNEHVQPNYRFRSGLLSHDTGTLIDAGGRLYLRFKPASMNGILQTAVQDQAFEPPDIERFH